MSSGGLGNFPLSHQTIPVECYHTVPPNPERLHQLIRRGLSVDVGVVETRAVNKDGVREQRQHEIDFVVNRDSERVYIQAVWEIPDEAKREQELFSLTHVHDGFRKIVVTGDPHEKPWMSKEGITFIGIVPFLLDPKSVETV